MNTQNLAELVIKAQRGDKNAMNDLVNACYNDIYYYVLKTVKKEDLAADVTQESFLEIITTLGKLREPSAFPLWSRRIAYHKCALHFRNSKEVLVEEDEEGETLFDRLPDESEGALPEQVLEDQEFRKTIMEMINSLPSEQTNALLLYYYEKLSIQEIATIQDTTSGTVKSRLNYARKAIKSKVEDYEKRTGTRLHAVAILPLLLRFAFGSDLSAMPAMSVPASLLTGGVSAAAGTAAGTAAGSAGAGAGASAASAAVAGGAAKTVGTALAAKIIGGVVAVSIAIGGGAYGVTKLTEKEDDTGSRSDRQESSFVLENSEPEDSDFRFEPGSSEPEEEPEDEPDEWSEPESTPEEEPDEWSEPESTPEEEPVVETGEGSKGLEFSMAFGNDCSVTGIGSCTDTEIVIPASYNGLPVESVRKNAFTSQTGITGVIIPDGVTSIGYEAFAFCTNLSSVRLPETLTSIGMYAFRGCKSLTNITIPDSVTTIPSEMFAECTSLSSITLPNSITFIAVKAFRSCTSLADITYNGTKSEWNNIIKNSWDLGTPNYTVHCTDGDLKKRS